MVRLLDDELVFVPAAKGGAKKAPVAVPPKK
jgi:hypothetical protein